MVSNKDQTTLSCQFESKLNKYYGFPTTTAAMAKEMIISEYMPFPYEITSVVKIDATLAGIIPEISRYINFA